MLITKVSNLVSNLACPIEGEQLEAHEQQLVCKNGHAFDVARQGYINLLPVQHKRSKEPGDSKDMVIARTRFLNAGLYTPVANKLIEIIKPLIDGSQQICLMDAGCGEGFYLERIADSLENNKAEGRLSFIGLDISKYAIMAAAKRNKKITWVVGTNRQPPVCMASVDIILCVFGFHSFAGFSSVLKEGGQVILVEPGVKHLKELRQVIYADIKKTEPHDISSIEAAGFSLNNTVSLQFETGDVNKEQINDLLLMTPHFYRASKEGKEAASHLKKLNLSVDMVFSIFEKTTRV